MKWVFFISCLSLWSGHMENGYIVELYRHSFETQFVHCLLKYSWKLSMKMERTMFFSFFTPQLSILFQFVLFQYFQCSMLIYFSFCILLFANSWYRYRCLTPSRESLSNYLMALCVLDELACWNIEIRRQEAICYIFPYSHMVFDIVIQQPDDHRQNVWLQFGVRV